MKKIVLALSCLISLSAFSQDNFVDVILDGKPAKMNTTTGVYTFTEGAPNSYTSNKATLDANIKVVTTTVNTLPSQLFEGKIHTVVKGETLYSISKHYGNSIAQIKSLNNLTTNIIGINQQLKIGNNTLSKIINSSIYVVEKGDTLYQIAKKINLSVDELKQLNNIETHIISIGQKLIIK